MLIHLHYTTHTCPLHMVSYKDITTKTQSTLTNAPNKQLEVSTGCPVSNVRRFRREPLTLNALKEIFIDANLDEFINLHQSLVEKYNMFGYLNDSTSSKFIHMVVDNIIINNLVTRVDASTNAGASEDEGR